MSGFYPDLAFRYRHPARTSPRQPQNLPRPTWKGVDGLNGMGCACDGNAGPKAAMRGLLGLRAIGELEEEGRMPPGTYLAYSVLSMLGSTTGAYHGYKRNNSLGWALAWFVLGSMFPMVTIPVSLAQGFAKRA